MKEFEKWYFNDPESSLPRDLPTSKRLAAEEAFRAGMLAAAGMVSRRADEAEEQMNAEAVEDKIIAYEMAMISLEYTEKDIRKAAEELDKGINPKHRGTSFDSFLEEEGIKDEVEAEAIRRVAAIEKATTEALAAWDGVYTPWDIDEAFDKLRRILKATKEERDERL